MLNYFDKLFLGRDCTDKLLKYLDENLILLKVLFSPTESFFNIQKCITIAAGQNNISF